MKQGDGDFLQKDSERTSVTSKCGKKSKQRCIKSTDTAVHNYAKRAYLELSGAFTSRAPSMLSRTNSRGT